LHLAKFRNGERTPENVYVVLVHYIYIFRDGQTPCRVWLASVDRRHCSNTAKMRNTLKCAGVPQTTRPFSAASGPKFTIYCGDVWRRYCCLTRFFRLWIRALVARYSPTKLCHGAQMANFLRFLRPVFAASLMQHVSDLHVKFRLRPHHVCKYGRHPICDG